MMAHRRTFLYQTGRQSIVCLKLSVIQILSRKKLTRTKQKRESSDEDSSEEDPEINMGIERVPYKKEQQHMRSNPLLLTPISGRVQICTGCKVLFTDKERKQPHDMVFRIQMRRQYTKDGKKKNSSEEKAMCSST